MKVLYAINDKLEEELKRICKKDEMSISDLDAAYKMVDVIKDVTTIEAMLNSERNGYSGTYYDDYSGTNSYNSYARGRDSRGRYTSRDGMPNGYSGHANEEMMDRLRSMARNARSEEERQNYMSIMDRMSM